MEREAIEEGGSQSLITADKLSPLRGGDGRGDDQTDMVVQGGQTAKEQIRSYFGKGDKPDFIEDEKIEPEQACFEPGEPNGCLRLQQLIG